MTVTDNIGIVPKVPDWNKDNKVTDLEFLNKISYTDLDVLNDSLIRVASGMNELNKKLSIYEKSQAHYEIEYKRKYRKIMMESDLPTDSQKKLYAEVQCEDLEMKILYSKQIIGKLKRNSNTFRISLDVLQTIGNNVRKEMGL